MKTTEIPIGSIIRGENISRSSTSKGDSSELARTIESTGWVSPLVVRRAGKQYELIAGSRRLDAILQIREEHPDRWKTVPVQVVEANDVDRDLINVAENAARKDVSIVEFGEACQILSSRHGLSYRDIAVKTGKSAATVSNCINVLKAVHPDILGAIRAGKSIPWEYISKWRRLSPESQLEAYHRWIGVSNPTPNERGKAPKGKLDPKHEFLQELKLSHNPKHKYAALVLSWALGHGRKPKL